MGVKRMVKENLAAEIGGSVQSTTSTGFGDASSSSDAAVSNISHLVRRQRKTDEDPDDDSKKPKTETGSGDAPVNGHSNGTSGIKGKTVEDVQMAAESTS